ncbi:CocE/NonD family hydrolase [Teratosphaeria destructans]|uniref:CocE/NonD family hydrolase n=1 Tax=Teratosphaeria destructans TaxID=418781 RepID=A0A9W7SZV4_9PEZI|nr:CocE/NonD family hydrolase [Teratosphaeria destructans]
MAGLQKIGPIDVLYRDGFPSTEHPLYPGFRQETKVYPQGTIFRPGALALPCDIVHERDIPVKLRDGVTIYTDVYRPPNAPARSVPAVVQAGPFGKNGGVNRDFFDKFHWRSGVPKSTVSTLEKFEALDPAYWVHHGYAIVCPDPRGCWKSEGNTHINCTQDGQDGYDLVEWLAEQPWCNGRVSYAGNSWLSQTQWFIGAEKPPHLTCLAPWEGWNDLYNDDLMRGGVPAPAFQQWLLDDCSPSLVSGSKTEDVEAMAKKYPLWNEYWASRAAKLEKIDVPMYIVSSWTNALHCRGTFQGWSRVASKEKWLRVHNSHEWPDLYYPQNVEDLRKFYDFYLKDISNGWEHTPKVRLCVLNPGGEDIVNRPEREFPLARVVPTKLHLDSSASSLVLNEPVKQAHSVTFDAATGVVAFEHTFEQRTELTGFFSLKLWIEAIDTDDLDIYCKFTKLDAHGQPLETMTMDVGWLQDDPDAERQKLREMHAAGDPSVDIFWAEGSNGRLRVSHRETDPFKSTPSRPVYTHQREQKLKAGEIVPVLIELWPHGMIWEKGQKVRLSIAGHNLRPEQLPFIPKASYNKGKAVIHTGGEYDSHLLVPLVPNEA